MMEIVKGRAGMTGWSRMEVTKGWGRVYLTFLGQYDGRKLWEGQVSRRPRGDSSDREGK
jgi:hypothetical protein